MQMRTGTDLIFIVGNSRSGTTMLARILGLSSEIHSFDELHYIEQMVTGADFSSTLPLEREKAVALMASLLSVARRGYFAKKTPEKYMGEAAELVDRTTNMTYSEILRSMMLDTAQAKGKRIACEQTPRNVFYIREILERYPHAAVVNIIRDPRDVVLSQKNKWKRRRLGGAIPRFEAWRSWMNYHPYTISRIWTMAVGSALGFRDNSRVLSVRYEDLVSDPESSLKAIADHCGVPFEQTFLDVPQLGSSSRADQGTRGIDKSRLAAWKQGGLGKPEIEICERQCRELMEEFGYEVSGIKADRFSLVLMYLLVPVKLFGALFFNLRRVRNLPSWISQRMSVRRAMTH
ncbi:MAG: hypothetical protein CML23_06875 [Rhizobiaceae bacterium]|nr:hypothetical protein [Rhizobiaceae bacterium]|tara:strand:- start:3961 stop:5001 length:1041 start_codon:yes stop_codon:yes gene_type:complete